VSLRVIKVKLSSQKVSSMKGLFHDQFYIPIVFLTEEISLSTLLFSLQCMFETIIIVEVVIDFRIIKEGLGSV